MATTVLEVIQREGMAKGKAEGIAEGMAKGMAKGKIGTVIAFLETRFGEVPAGIQKKLTNLQDDSRIEKIIKLAATCQSLKEFQKAL